MSADRISDVPPWASCNHDAPLRSIRARRLHLEPNRMTGAEDFQFSVRCKVQKIIRTPPAVRITSTLRWTNSAARSLMYDCVCKFGGERGNGRKMAFTFGREQTIGSWLRVSLGHFSIGKKQKGCYLQSCATNTNMRRAPQCCSIKQRQGMYRERCARSMVL